MLEEQIIEVGHKARRIEWFGGLEASLECHPALWCQGDYQIQMII